MHVPLLNYTKNSNDIAVSFVFVIMFIIPRWPLAKCQQFKVVMSVGVGGGVGVVSVKVLAFTWKLM